MKKLIISFLTIIGLTVALFAFTTVREGGIQGKITPAEGVREVVTVIGADTLRSQLSNGVFVFPKMKRGTYNLTIRTNAPYKDATVQNVAVTDSATTDIGEIKLLQ